MSIDRLSAVIFVPDGPEAPRWERVNLEFCERKGYAVVAVVRWRPGDEWRELHDMAGREEFDVLVVARRDHLPAKRRPRIEVVEEAAAPTARRGWRPRLLR